MPNNNTKRKLEGAKAGGGAPAAAATAQKGAKKPRAEKGPRDREDNPSGSSGAGGEPPNPAAEAENRSPAYGKRIAKLSTLEVLDVIRISGRSCTFRPDSLRALAEKGEAAIRRKVKKARKKGAKKTQGGGGEAVPPVSSGGDQAATIAELMKRLEILERGAPTAEVTAVP